MNPVTHCTRLLRAALLCSLCTLPISAGSQPNQGASAPLSSGGKRICSLRDLALLVNERYARPGFPIATYSNLILVGHSLGAIEHQNLVRALKERGFDVPYVVTFGAPIVALPDPGTLYRYVKADLDLVAAADRVVAGDGSVIRISGGSADLFDLKNGSHHVYWKSAALEQLDIFGDRKTPSSPCLQIAASTRREYRGRAARQRLRRLSPRLSDSDRG